MSDKRQKPLSAYRMIAEAQGHSKLLSVAEQPTTIRESCLYNAALRLVTLLDSSPGLELTAPIHMACGEVMAVLACYKVPRP